MSRASVGGPWRRKVITPAKKIRSSELSKIVMDPVVLPITEISYI
jgi:hypothetical protein